jgi:hypothetical protein
MDILDFNVEDFMSTSLQIGQILTFEDKNYLILTMLFVLSTNVACMCSRSIMCCSGQDQIGLSSIPLHDFLKIQVIYMSKKKKASSDVLTQKLVIIPD